jgi:hypothetical protein
VEGGHEHGALEGELEGAWRQQFAQDVRDPKRLPQAPEQERSTDALAGEPGGLARVFESGEKHDVFAEAGS